MNSFIPVLFAASLLGVVSHRCYFIHGEHHVAAPRILQAYSVALVALYFTCRILGSKENNNPFAAATCIAGTYLASLFSSIAVYRLFFHEITGIPGPRLARLTKLYHVVHAADCKQYLWFDRLNKKYGDFVRTGPNEVTIFTPKAIALVHGPDSECTRSEWYDLVSPLRSISHTRTRQAHDPRRLVWDQAFSIKALKQYEGPILRETELLERKIRESEGKDINITPWFESFAYDLLGLVGFSKSFNMLEDGKTHWVVDTINGGTNALGPFSGVPWFILLVHATPFIGAAYERACIWGRKTIRERAANKSQEKSHSDIMAWLIEDAQSRNGVEADMKWLLGDFFVMCVAGTEPVVTSLLYLFYHLASSPECIAKLRAEIRTLTSYSDTIQLQKLHYLTALIYETLRLHPSVPAGGLRITPPQGLRIDGTFIPGGTTVLTPQYSIGRREDCYVQPNNFIPERWTTRPELVKDRSAFFAWNAGPFACVGKNLGLMEIRTATVVLLDKFDIKFAAGEDGSKLLNDSKDCFSLLPAALNLVFTARVPEAKIM